MASSVVNGHVAHHKRAVSSAAGILSNSPTTGLGWEEFPRAEMYQSIPARFAKIAAEYPEQLALIDTDASQLTYRQLDEKSNQIAHAILAELGGGAEPVALIFDHGARCIAALLGVLKAGKFFVPLEPLQGSERLSQILEEIDARLMITDAIHAELANRAARKDRAVLNVDELPDELSQTDVLASIPEDAYAYIIFTSGSTGQPKGVIETHRNVLHFVYIFTNGLKAGRFDRILLTARPSFSGGYQSLFGGLLIGARICLYDVKGAGLDGLEKWLAHWEVTLWTLTPSIFRGFIATMPSAASVATMRILRLGADRVLLSDIEAFRRLFPRTTTLYLGLGTSEIKVCSECFLTHDSDLSSEVMPIGFAVADVETRVVDESGAALGTGKVGEIVIRTRYASPGYWKRPEITRDRFRPDPSAAGVVLYHTGDRGWLDEEGCLYFVGRQDTQVKILGHRVELTEVEAVLVSLDIVQAAAVSFRAETDSQTGLLTAYIVPEEGQASTVSEVRRRLVGRLPDYMIPHKFVFLSSLPVNLNGKIDRRALPDPQTHRPNIDIPYVGPRSLLEERLAVIWSDVLEIDKVGVNDQFFELGGDSLRATLIVSQVANSFGVTLPQRALFAAPTVAEMALAIVQHCAANLTLDEIERLLTRGLARSNSDG